MLNLYLAKPSLQIAARIMQQGGVIAYPTEGVWGLGCNPFDKTAIERLLSIKGRRAEKGVILIAANFDQLKELIQPLSKQQQLLIDQSLPEPQTWLVPASDKVPLWISGKHSTVAVRISTHPLVRALCLLFGGAIVSTSANPQGKPAPIMGWQVHRYFHHHPQLDMIVKGQTAGIAKPSRITNLVTGDIIRP